MIARSAQLDLRAGAAFIGAAKGRTSKNRRFRSDAETRDHATDKKKINWQSWLRPAFAVPAFAALLDCRFLPESCNDSFSPHGCDSSPAYCHRRPFMQGPAARLILRFWQIARKERYFRLNFRRIQALRLFFSLCTILRVSTFGLALVAAQGRGYGDGIVSLVIPGSGLTQGVIFSRYRRHRCPGSADRN